MNEKDLSLESKVYGKLSPIEIIQQEWLLEDKTKLSAFPEMDEDFSVFVTKFFSFFAHNFFLWMGIPLCKD